MGLMQVWRNLYSLAILLEVTLRIRQVCAAPTSMAEGSTQACVPPDSAPAPQLRAPSHGPASALHDAVTPADAAAAAADDAGVPSGESTVLTSPQISCEQRFPGAPDEHAAAALLRQLDMGVLMGGPTFRPLLDEAIACVQQRCTSTEYRGNRPVMGETQEGLQQLCSRSSQDREDAAATEPAQLPRKRARLGPSATCSGSQDRGHQVGALPYCCLSIWLFLSAYVGGVSYTVIDTGIRFGLLCKQQSLSGAKVTHILAHVQWLQQQAYRSPSGPKPPKGLFLFLTGQLISTRASRLFSANAHAGI